MNYQCSHCDDSVKRKKMTPLSTGDALLCEGCIDDLDWCDVCETYQHFDGLCRHLFWVDDHGLLGSGSHDWGDHRPSFEAVLEKIGKATAHKLLDALKLHKYYFQIASPMIGGGGYIVADLPNGLGGIQNYGQAFIKDLTGEEERQMSIGMQWLLSLWSNAIHNCPENIETASADMETVKWIEAWLKNKEGAIAQ